MEQIELPLVEVLAAMEHAGVLVDQEGVRQFGDRLSGEIRSLEEEIYGLAGHSFNISSPKQLGQVLFEELGIPHPQGKKKTKTGSFSTNAEVLEKLRSQYPIVSLVLRYRQLTKLSSTYVAGLLKTVAPDGRIHTCFKQTETRTGRISSTASTRGMISTSVKPLLAFLLRFCTTKARRTCSSSLYWVEISLCSDFS